MEVKDHTARVESFLISDHSLSNSGRAAEREGA